MIPNANITNISKSLYIKDIFVKLSTTAHYYTLPYSFVVNARHNSVPCWDLEESWKKFLYLGGRCNMYTEQKNSNIYMALSSTRQHFLLGYSFFQAQSNGSRFSWKWNFFKISKAYFHSYNVYLRKFKFQFFGVILGVHRTPKIGCFFFKSKKFIISLALLLRL